MANIVYAGYGFGSSTVDISEAVSNAYHEGQREFSATNDLGGDPAPGEGKCLFVVWSEGGTLRSGVTGEEDGPLVIP